MKLTGYSVIYINDVPHVALHNDNEHEWPVLTMEDAQKASEFLIAAINQVKSDEQKRKFREHLDRATKTVDAMPEWKRNLLGCIVRQNTSPDDPDWNRYSHWLGGDTCS